MLDLNFHQAKILNLLHKLSLLINYLQTFEIIMYSMSIQVESQRV